MTLLIDDLLVWSEMDGAGPTARQQPVQLARAIRLAVDDLHLADVTIRCPESLLVLADPGHLRRMLENYLTNAVKYGAPPFQIATRQLGGQVEIGVTDHGAGVPSDLVPRLFDEFARAETPSDPALGGTGLGLSIVRALALANDGWAYLQRQGAGGTCFALRLPVGHSVSPARRPLDRGGSADPGIRLDPPAASARPSSNAPPATSDGPPGRPVRRLEHATGTRAAHDRSTASRSHDLGRSLKSWTPVRGRRV